MPAKLAPPPAFLLSRRRNSVSAEAMGRFAARESSSAPAAASQPPKSPRTRARIRAATNKNLLFRDLEDAQRTELEDAMFLVEHGSAGVVVIRQGADGDNFYVVEEGELSVEIERGGESSVVGAVGPGGSFGELALMYNTPRAATVATRGAVKLWALDRVTFRRILLITTLNRRKKFESFLAKVPVLASLTPYERASLSDALLPRTYEDGEVIIAQGERGEEFYIIEDGAAELWHVPDEDVGDVPPTSGDRLGSLGPGDYCGEVALMRETPRALTVIATRRTKVVYVDRKTFVRLMGPCIDVLKRNMGQYKELSQRRSYKDLSEPEQSNGQGPAAAGAAGGSSGAPPPYQRSRRGGVSAGVTHISADFSPPVHPKGQEAQGRIRRAMIKNPLFRHIDEQQLKTVVDAMFERSYADGDLIIRQGDDGDNFYVVDSGECAIDIAKGGADPITVGTLREGGSMGELALMYNCPRAATIRAVGEVTCWAVDGDTFRHILASSALSQRKKYESFLERVPILESLTNWERSTVADALVDQTFEPGQEIVRQGAEGDRFYIVVEGECHVSIQDPETRASDVVKELRASDYFGEIALLTDAPRKASVHAKTSAKVVYLDRPAFTRLLGSIDEILKRNMANYTTQTDKAKCL